MTTTIQARRYKVSLLGFSFTGHRGPDGQLHLSPVHKEGYDTQAEFCSSLVVEAVDREHAEGVFKRTLGITRTEREFQVELLPEPTEPTEDAAETEPRGKKPRR